MEFSFQVESVSDSNNNPDLEEIKMEETPANPKPLAMMANTKEAFVEVKGRKYASNAMKTDSQFIVFK